MKAVECNVREIIAASQGSVFNPNSLGAPKPVRKRSISNGVD